MDFKVLSADESACLELPFSFTDIKEMIRNSIGDISLCPDGFSMYLYKTSWNIIVHDLNKRVN